MRLGALFIAISVVGCVADVGEEGVVVKDQPLTIGNVGIGASTDHVVPDRALTPGEVLSVDVTKICTPGYSRGVRNVSSAEKAQVAANYKFTGPSSSVEYDHLISLELGGSNAVANLWPEPIADARVKDRLENRLRTLVCSGKMNLANVQLRIAEDWVSLWREIGQP